MRQLARTVHIHAMCSKQEIRLAGHEEHAVPQVAPGAGPVQYAEELAVSSLIDNWLLVGHGVTPLLRT